MQLYISSSIALLVSALCLTRFGEAFVTRSTKSLTPQSRQGQEFPFVQGPLASSSYDVDAEEEAEQLLGEEDITPAVESQVVTPLVNGNGASSSAGRYDDLIASVGLEGKLKHVSSLPKERTISSFDIFCNRELKNEYISAIGFDMDYTLVQYQQPAFDKLAFDGAKEKLVKKLGYPEEVLDFEYDHEVRDYKAWLLRFCCNRQILTC